jgi:hypothetical protein
VDQWLTESGMRPRLPYSGGQLFSVLFPGHPGSIPNSITPGGDIYGCLALKLM